MELSELDLDENTMDSMRQMRDEYVVLQLTIEWLVVAGLSRDSVDRARRAAIAQMEERRLERLNSRIAPLNHP
jgi:hypothetical protein